MSSLVRLHVLLFAVLAIADQGCEKHNPYYCLGAPHNNCLDVDAAVDGPKMCKAPGDCMAPAAVCDLGDTNTCVQCTLTEHDACMGATPACGSDHMCQACTSHGQCDSKACLPDGSCGNDSNVAYVDPSGTDNAMCTMLMPCTKASQALATNRPYVKFQNITDEQVMISNQVVTLLADRGAKLTSTKPGGILQIIGSSVVSIYDLTISDGLGGAGVGISMPVGSTGALKLLRTTVANNAGGGVSVAGGSFVIVGSLFFNNGGNTSLIGGVSISTITDIGNRLEFNSFNKNTTRDNFGPAIHCAVNVVTAKNNIMSGNGTPTQVDQVGGACTHAYSIARPGTVPPGTGNFAADPLFVDTNAGDLHIVASSPARRVADPSTDLSGLASRDIDGDRRVAPADIGADQVP